MEMTWYQSLLFGLISGLTDILPVSAQAHKAILLKLFGESGEMPVMRLMIHLATLAALYLGCRSQIARIMRQRKLAKIPKRRRKRPVDTRILLDLRLLKTTLIPIVIGFLIYVKTASLGNSLQWVSVFLLVNGAVMYLPALLPSGNKDSRAMSRFDGLLMGLGGAAAVLPGISSVGAATSIAVLRGADRNYALNISLLMQMVMTVGFIIFDIVSLFTGAGALSFGVLMGCLLAAIAAFIGTFCAVRMIRAISVHMGFECFSYYCFGAAFFAFILFLI